MYELKQVGARTYYIECPAKLGVYRYGEQEVCLIDSGSDSSAAKLALRRLDEQGWRLGAVFNTHSHADHVGGNALLQQRTGCPAYAYGLEVPFVCQPVMEPLVLFGALPYKEIRNKFLMARPSRCLPLTEDALPRGLTLLPLPGHAADMVGYRTDDGVWFLADAVVSEETLEKYHVSYLYDPAAYLASLDLVEGLDGSCFIPSHAAPAQDIRPLAEANRRKALEVLELVASLCRTPRTAEQVIQGVFTHYGLKMVHNQYATVGATLRSYLSYLHDQGRLEAAFADNLLLWQTPEA